MADDILQANTPFGEQVIAASSKPADPIHIGGVPLDEFLAEDRRRIEQGLPTQSEERPADRTASQLFSEASEKMLFAREDEKSKLVDTSIAANRAYSEVLINDDPLTYQERKDRNQSTTVKDAAIELTRKLLVEQDLPRSGFLAPETFGQMSPEEQLDAATREMNRLDLREITPLNVALIETFLSGGGQVKLNEFEKFARQLDVSAIKERLDYRTRIARRKASAEVDSLAAANSWSSYGDMAVEVAVQDFTPILPLITRLGLIDGLTKAAGIPVKQGWRGFFIGETRQNLREGLVAMNPEEFFEAAKSMRLLIEEWKRDPVKSKLLTKYNIIETYEATFTDDVRDGVSAKNAGDRWFGNVETLLEGIFSVVVVGKATKGIRGLFTSSDAVAARNIALVSDAPDVASKIDEMIQADDLAVEFGLEADEAVTALLPRPPSFINDVENLPDGTKSVVHRTERVRSEILNATDSLTGLGLTKVDRTNAVNKTLTDLDLNDGAHVQGRMNTLQMLDDGTGFKMRVVVGDSAKGGYENIEDVIREAVDIDPLLESVNIQRIGRDGVLEPVFDSPQAFARAVTKGELDTATAQRIIGGDNPDGTFYLTYDRERFWHTADKESLGSNSFLSSGIVPRALLSPNAKFGDEIYGTFVRAYMGEQAILRDFEILFQPFYQMGREDKLFVSSAFEWMEDFGKNHGRAPDIGEVISRYDGVTETQLNGMIALRDGMDTLHELFNRKLYRDWQALGYKTARPSESALPTFHGLSVPRDAAGSGMALDPVTGKMVRMTRSELDDLYNAGGSIMELDMAVDAANEARHKATRIIAREGDYQVGELSTKPLVYHPGYSIRFYDDPYYIVKETQGVALNGSVRSGPSSVSSEAVRTAGTKAEAENFMRKAQFTDDKAGVQGVEWKVVRANDISQTESTLFQKQSIHREGRLFWDNRNFDRLPDVNGSRATLEDPVRSLERGIGQAARQLTHEDPLKQIKAAWKNDYGDLVDKELLERFDLKELSGRLKDLSRNTVDRAAKARINESRELINYLRLVEGTNSAIIPLVREGAIGVATAINRWTGGTGRIARGLESRAQIVDPFRAMRSVAFHAFMVFRPVRQAILQSSQIGYLAALKPSYVATPQFFKDAYGLRRGIASLRKSGYDDGFSIGNMAKQMGLTKTEYRTLIKEANRSGLLDLVDVHDFAGGARKFEKTPVDGATGTVGYKARQFTRGVSGALQKWGFNFGERNNLTFTYNLALKRAMERKKYKSLLEMSTKDWDDLRVEASNLALGMVRPNSFGYQTGALGTATQFLGFTHKAALGLLGQNPAIKNADALKIVFGTYLLYGANMYGSRDWADEQLTSIGVPDQEIPNTGMTLVDLISGGVIDNTFNMLGDLTVEDWKDVDLGFLAPGVDFNRLWEMNLGQIMDQPLKAPFGPFGNIASKTMESFEFVSMVHRGMPDLDPADKFTISANAMLSGILPVYNDVVKAYQGYQLNQWYSTSGEALPLRPTMNTILARALTGARSREEMSYYRLQNKIWEDTSAYRNIVDENKKFLSRMVTALSDGTMTRDDVHRNIGAMVNMWEEWPEGIRLQMLRDSMEFKQADSLEPTIYKQLVDALKDRKFDSGQLDSMVDRFVDIPAEQRAQLKILIREAHESRVNVDAEAFEQLQEEQQ